MTKCTARTAWNLKINGAVRNGQTFDYICMRWSVCLDCRKTLSVSLPEQQDIHRHWRVTHADLATGMQVKNKFRRLAHWSASVASRAVWNKTANARINVTWRRVRVTIVAVEKQYVLRILSVCSFSYPTCKAHAPYYIVICGLSGCTKFFHILIIGTIIGRSLQIFLAF